MLTVHVTQEDTTTTSTFLERIAEGEHDAIEPCMQQYGGLVSSLARRFLPPAEIDDAVQEIFIELWKNASRYSRDKAAESTFIAMIARRRLIDRVRKNARRPRPQSIDTAYDLGERDENIRSDSNEDLSRAKRAIEQLSDHQKLVIRLSFTEGKSHQEISDATGMALGSVKTHLRRGMIKLRELMAADKRNTATGGTT